MAPADGNGGTPMSSPLFKRDTPHGRSSRAPALGRRGMVASGHPYATQAGLDVLKEGGNAFDAIVAVASTLNVVEPYMSGVGGIGLALVHDAKERRTRVLNFSGRAPARATPEAFDDHTKAVGARAPLVPGNPAGWWALHEGQGVLPWKRCFRDAVNYAEHGFSLTPFNADMLKANWGFLSEYGSLRRGFLGDAGAPPAAGDLFRQPDLAGSLAAIAEGGVKVFYEGKIAQAITRTLSRSDGLMAAEDLAAYQVEWQEPLAVNYRGYEIRLPPPNSSGFQIAETMNILAGFDRLDYGTEETLHVFIEAVKLALADRIAYAGDPDCTDIPIERLLSAAHAAELRRKIDLKTAGPLPAERFSESYRDTENWWRHGLTTHFATADGEGNVVTITQTLGNAFGAGVIPDETGILLNNMSLWFDTDPRSVTPNLIGPRKRVDFCVAPCQVARDGRLVLSVGTPGSYGIMQTTAQILHHFIDAGMNIQEAIEAPRFRLLESGVLNFERRFPEVLLEGLNARGHQAMPLAQGWSRLVGGAHGIHIRADGAYFGGADPRRDGIALGF